MLRSIMENIRRNENYNMEEIFQEYDLSDEEFGELINFLYLENIPEVRVAVENNDFAVINNENIDVEEKQTIEFYLNDIKEHNLRTAEGTDEDDRDQLEINNGKSLEEISKEMNIELNYLTALQEIFTELDDTPENSYSLIEKVSTLTKKYVLSNIPKKLNYLDEKIILMYYGLGDKVYVANEISKSLKISKENINVMKEKALTKLAFNINKDQIEESLEYLN